MKGKWQKRWKSDHNSSFFKLKYMNFYYDPILGLKYDYLDVEWIWQASAIHLNNKLGIILTDVSESYLAEQKITNLIL